MSKPAIKTLCLFGKPILQDHLDDKLDEAEDYGKWF